MRIAVVIPAYNEAGNIGPLIEETIAAVPAGTLQEVIVVDDASDDGTDAEIKALLGRHPVLRYLRHGRRAGQSAALRSGVRAATAPVIATMDGDGPERSCRYHAALGPARPRRVASLPWLRLREDRKAKGSRRAASRFANWIRDKVLADGCPDTRCGLKLYWREANLTLPYFTSMHRYLPVFFLTYGHEIAYEPVNDRRRLRGASKYTNLGRALIGLLTSSASAGSANEPCFRRSRKPYPAKLRPVRRPKPAQPSRSGVFVRMNVANLARWWATTPITELVWISIGFIAQFLFSIRFIVQWLATERARASIIPETFWYFSRAGGALLLAYAVYRMDPVFIVGQAAGLAIYARNVYFIWLGKRAPSQANIA